MIILGSGFVCVLLAVSQAVEKNAGAGAIQLLLSSWIVLVWYGLMTHDAHPLAAEGIRGMSVLLAVLTGVVGLIILEATQRCMSAIGYED
ncbi:hypothetical protein ACNJNU_05050 [Citrobacter freundii]|uniref:hypothetical protein n=1 Tax=Citrobacter freundii TaxID=546 RepID=UPI003A8A4E83